MSAERDRIADPWGRARRFRSAARGPNAPTSSSKPGRTLYHFPHADEDSAGRELQSAAPAGGAMLVPALGPVDAKVVPAVVFGTTALRFVLTGVYG